LYRSIASTVYPKLVYPIWLLKQTVRNSTNPSKTLVAVVKHDAQPVPHDLAIDQPPRGRTVSDDTLAQLAENIVVCNSKAHDTTDVRLVKAALGGQLFESDRAADRDFASYIMA
jgi:hypothetical protein